MAAVRLHVDVKGRSLKDTYFIEKEDEKEVKRRGIRVTHRPTNPF